MREEWVSVSQVYIDAAHPTSFNIPGRHVSLSLSHTVTNR